MLIFLRLSDTLILWEVTRIMSEALRRLSLFIGMIASICWIFVVMLFPVFFSSRGQIMPFDPWIIIAAGLGGAVVSFFAATAAVLGIAKIMERHRKKRPR